jgi:hypothetical protein
MTETLESYRETLATIAHLADQAANGAANAPVTELADAAEAPSCIRKVFRYACSRKPRKLQSRSIR